MALLDFSRQHARHGMFWHQRSPQEEAEHRIAAALDEVQRQVAGITEMLHGASAGPLGAAGHQLMRIANTVQRESPRAARFVGDEARALGSNMRSHPVPYIIALGTIVLVASLLARE